MTSRLLPVAVAVTATLAAAGSVAAASRPTIDRRTEVTILAEMNRARADAGVPALRSSKLLRGPARVHSVYLHTTGTFTHDGAGGTPFWKRLVAAGYGKNRPMAENLAIMDGCPKSAGQIVKLWLASPSHRKNLLSPKYTVVGVGVAANGACGRAVYTTDFGG